MCHVALGDPGKRTYGWLYVGKQAPARSTFGTSLERHGDHIGKFNPSSHVDSGHDSHESVEGGGVRKRFSFSGEKRKASPPTLTGPISARKSDESKAESVQGQPLGRVERTQSGSGGKRNRKRTCQLITADEVIVTSSGSIGPRAVSMYVQVYPRDRSPVNHSS